MDARTSYREAAVRGASPVQLVICLYEQAIADLRRAVVALNQGDIEGRTRGINHALQVITQLQGTLDMKQGGDVARNLSRLYAVVRAALVEAQFRQSAATVEQQIVLLMQVHEAWCEVERRSAAPAVGQPKSAARAESETGGFSDREASERAGSERNASEWSA
jgi:flagellar protein FliS